MQVMMNKDQFEELKKKAGKAKVELTEEKDSEGLDGTMETDDFIIGFHFNPAEGRLYFGPISKRKTLAAFIAGENVVGTYLMELFSSIPSAKSNGKDAGGEEKKDQSHHQHSPSQQASQ